MSNNNDWFYHTNPTLHPQEFIELTAFPKQNGPPKICYIQNETDYKCFVETHRLNYNIFYSVGLTDGTGRKAENIIGANFIVLDFDFKGYAIPPCREFTNELQERLPLFIYQVVDSGHGYHAYIPIEYTTDIPRWNDVTKRLAEIYNADEKAALPTQLIRAPGSLNWKDLDRPLSVNVIYSNKSKRYTLSNLEKLIEKQSKPKRFGSYVDMKPCISKMLEGVDKGERNFALGRLVYDFKLKNFTREQTYEILKNWNLNKNAEPKPQREFDSEFENYWNSDMCMGSCYIKSKSFQNKLDKFCVAECPIKNHTTVVHKQLQTIDIPISFCNPNTLQILNGNELALLMQIYKKREIKIAELRRCTKYSTGTMSDYIKHLTKCGYIQREGNVLISKTPKSYNNMLHVSEEYLNSTLTKTLSGTYFKVYASILWHNFFKQKPTVQALANALDMNKSNVSPIVKNLIKEGVIYNDSYNKGLTTIYQLYA